MKSKHLTVMAVGPLDFVPSGINSKSVAKGDNVLQWYSSPHPTWQPTLCSCHYCKSSELGRPGTFLAFVQAQWVGLIKHPLTAPGTPPAQIIPVWWMSEMDVLGSTELYGCCQDTRITSHGLWPGWKFTDAWSPPSCNPINSSSKRSPLSSPGPQQALPSISLWVGRLSGPSNSEVPWLNYRDPSLLKAWLMPTEKNYLKWAFYWTQGELLTGTFICPNCLCAWVSVNWS